MRYEKEYLQKKIQAIADDIQTLVRPHSPLSFEVIWYGAYEIDAKHLVFWICVQTDKLKKQLEADETLNAALKDLEVECRRARKEGYRPFDLHDERLG